MKTATITFVLIALLQLQCNASNESWMRTWSGERVRRRVGQLEIDTTPLEYMKQLRSSIADEDGKPRDLLTAPTSVWCFLDKAIVDDVHREKPTGEGGKCGAISRFMFDWEAVANTTYKALTSSLIRPYMQVINRFVRENQTVPVNISVSVKLFSLSSVVNASNTTLSSRCAPHLRNVSSENFHVQTINITRNSSGWLELDMTKTILSVWNPYEHQAPLIEVTLRMKVDCIEHKKVPIQFINPAEVKLTKPVRRQKHTNLQPLLIVYMEDHTVKEKLLKEREMIIAEATGGADITAESDKDEKAKRSTNPEACKVENFTVNFFDLRLDNIITPVSSNVRRCGGDCGHETIKLERNLATNHAKIMASAKLLNDRRGFRSPNSTMYLQQHKSPCCVPVEYRSLFILLKFVGVLQQQLFPEFIVHKCACR